METIGLQLPQQYEEAPKASEHIWQPNTEQSFYNGLVSGAGSGVKSTVKGV